MENPDLSKLHSEMPPANIILLGLPGSGKTTLGELMEAHNPDLRYVSVGQISRDLADDDERRQYIDGLYMEHNKPVGDPEFFIELIRGAVKRARQEGKGIILDGIPKKPEEVEPLNRLLEDEGVKIDGLVICDVSPFTALKRVIDRGPREGGLDTVDTAINRGETYWQAIDHFKKRLGGFLGVKVVNIDTENMNPESALMKANEVLDGIRTREANANVVDIQTQEVTLDGEKLHSLLEAINLNDTKKVTQFMAEVFLDGRHKVLIDKILDADMNEGNSESEILKYLDAAPEFKNIPLAKSRYAKMLENNILKPVQNLAKVIPREAMLRSGGDSIDIDQLGKVITEALVSREIITSYQGKANNIKSADEYINEEFNIRKGDMEYIEAYLKDTGALPDGMTLRSLMSMQPSYWNIFTSSALVGSVDGNFQKHINSLPGSHHSLSVPIDMPRKMIANSMGEYQPFIEAVSTSERSGFDTSLGFLHVVGVDETGKAFQVEWPLLMQDSRLAMHPNALLRDMLVRGQEIYFNHDFWHNIVPVYAESFNLYHPHAPIAYGGLMKNYVEFGRALRSEKEEYEIFVAKCHAEAQQYRMENDPDYKEAQIQAAITILNDIPHLKQQLSQSDGAEFADRVGRYFTTVTIGRLLNIIPPDSPDLKPIIEKIEQDTELYETITRQDVLKLMFTQRMVLATKDGRLSFMQDLLANPDVGEDIRKKIISNMLPNVNNIERKPALSDELIDELCTHESIVATALKYIEPTNPHAESGATALYDALIEMGLEDVVLGSDQNKELRGLSLLRWLAIIAPQRDPLKGHMEKVHGKHEIIFGNGHQKPTEIIKRQAEVFKQDQHVYEYRRWAREFGQALAIDIYDLLLNDGQNNSNNQRAALYILANYDGAEESQKDGVIHAIHELDFMLDDLVAAKYTLSKSQLESIEALAGTSAGYSPELSVSIKDIVKRYSFLQQQELAYQSYGETSYTTSKSEIEDSTMNLLNL